MSRRSSAVRPPQMPSACRMVNAKSRHRARTGHEAQTAWARAMSAWARPLAEIGKNSSGSAVRQAARARQLLGINTAPALTARDTPAVHSLPDVPRPGLGSSSAGWARRRAERSHYTRVPLEDSSRNEPCETWRRVRHRKRTSDETTPRGVRHGGELTVRTGPVWIRQSRYREGRSGSSAAAPRLASAFRGPASRERGYGGSHP